MLISLIARHAGSIQRPRHPYDAWVAALASLRESGDSRLHPSDVACLVRGLSECDRADAAVDLVAEHLRRSWSAGRGRLLEPYCEALAGICPAMASVSQLPGDLIEAEFIARYQIPFGDRPGTREYAVRFADRPDVAELLAFRHLDQGRFVLLSRQGRGGMGEVWKAWDRSLSRTVAIKLLLPRTDDPSFGGERLAREAMINASLEHCGIIGVHEFNPTDPTRPFVVQRWIEGITLSECIQEYYSESAGGITGDAKRLRWRRIIQSFSAVCDAIAFAHGRGVVHGDIKPGNIIVGDFGQTVMTDWGLARRHQSGSTLDCNGAGIKRGAEGMTSTAHDEAGFEAHGAEIAGTPEYMAPEQTYGRIQPASDVFGLAATLYEILTGQPPYAWTGRIRPKNWLEAVRQGQFAPPRQIKRRLDAGLEAICLKGLMLDPARRYKSASEMAHDVHRHLAGMPVMAKHGM